MCAQERGPARVRACAHACVLACMRACMSACARARACVRACVGERARCLCVCVAPLFLRGFAVVPFFSLLESAATALDDLAWSN